MTFAKPVKIADKAHTDFVAGQFCCRCEGYTKRIITGKGKLTRRVDPHHLPPMQYYLRRRSCDWFTAPLCRACHGWMDTVEGKRWEAENVCRLYSKAIQLLVANGRLDESYNQRAARTRTYEELGEVVLEIYNEAVRLKG